MNNYRVLHSLSYHCSSRWRMCFQSFKLLRSNLLSFLRNIIARFVYVECTNQVNLVHRLYNYSSGPNLSHMTFIKGIPKQPLSTQLIGMKIQCPWKTAILFLKTALCNGIQITSPWLKTPEHQPKRSGEGRGVVEKTIFLAEVENLLRVKL